jgi:hypothetical protein
MNLILGDSMHQKEARETIIDYLLGRVVDPARLDEALATARDDHLFSNRIGSLMALHGDTAECELISQVLPEIMEFGEGERQEVMEAINDHIRSCPTCFTFLDALCGPTSEEADFGRLRNATFTKTASSFKESSPQEKKTDAAKERDHIGTKEPNRRNS